MKPDSHFWAKVYVVLSLFSILFVVSVVSLLMINAERTLILVNLIVGLTVNSGSYLAKAISMQKE